MAIQRDPVQDAKAVWKSGVDAVHGTALVKNALTLDHQRLEIQGKVGHASFDLDTFDRLIVVGAGKASAFMAIGLEHVLLKAVSTDKIIGRINITDEQAASLQNQLNSIQLSGVRPSGDNSLTSRAVTATQEIQNLVNGASPNDLCIVLLSGGGSAMLAAPTPPVTTEEKSRLANQLFSSGANIEQVNRVRQQLSLVKGGGLIRRCAAGKILTLVLSDVIGNPTDLIASGPTVQSKCDPSDAVSVLQQFELWDDAPDSVRQVLSRKPEDAKTIPESTTILLADNQSAVAAAGQAAEAMGYRVDLQHADSIHVTTDELGRRLAMKINEFLQTEVNRHHCFVIGSETTVKLCEFPGLGGRNQQLLLSALSSLRQEIVHGSKHLFCLLSGGTDGEDGPTTFAGGWIDNQIAITSLQRSDLAHCLTNNDATTFLQSLDCLLKVPPTGTNVCDLQVITLVQKHAID